MTPPLTVTAVPKATSSAPVLSLDGVSFSYQTPIQTLCVLKDIQLTLNRGEMVALMGPSGSGKSTLLHLAGLLESPQSGALSLNGHPINPKDDYGCTLLRRQHIGFVYQFHHLLPDFTALENVAMPLWVNGISTKAARMRAQALLERVGLTDRASHRPGELSGGQQQRIAIARALANSPSLLLADEPTGNLDTVTSQSIFDLFQELARENTLSVLMATHNPDLAFRMDRVLRLEDGKLVPLTRPS
jgi:lipoprotein-releasing system ATP-binding protein